MHPNLTFSPRGTALVEQLKERLASSSKHVFSLTDTLSLIAQLRTEITFPKSLSDRKFQRAVIEAGIFQEIVLTATYPFDSKRYHWGPFSEYELALSLKPGAYLSHGTAAALHNLTEPAPTTIYVNKEQSPKNSKGNLTQSGIDRAFSSKQRQSGYIVTHQQTEMILLSGKHSNRLGVVKLTGSEGEVLELTDLERTLIDIAVRPSYAGGARAVAQAYRTALPKVSVSRLTKMLEDLSYVYPYHQVVGFYLQNASISTSTLSTVCNTLGSIPIGASFVPQTLTARFDDGSPHCSPSSKYFYYPPTHFSSATLNR
jgi:hypothetical protein